MNVETTGREAAFFRAEGVLIARPAGLAAAWLAANAQHLSQRAARLSTVALSAPFALGLGDSSLGHRVAWASLRGMSADRIAVLGEEYAESYLLDDLRPTGVDLLERARRRGCANVLVSDLVSEIVQSVAAHLRVDHVVCNHLEYRGGRATGRLADPIVTRFGGASLRRFAQEHEIDLSICRAYGASVADQVLLASVQLPCAVFPDRGLRRIAGDLDWPVVES